MAEKISYHTWYAFSDEEKYTVSFKHKGGYLNRAGCFDCYWGSFSHNRDKKHFIFGWDAVPEYIDEVIKSFNDSFKNIKIRILDEEPVYYKSNSLDTSKEKKSNAKAILLTIDIDKEYSYFSKQYLYYIIHHLFRLLSLAEEVYNGYKLDSSSVERTKERDFAKLVSKVNTVWLDHGYSYRGVEFDFTPETVLALDNIELCNKVFNAFNGSVKKQTDILFSIYYNSSFFKKINSINVIDVGLAQYGLKRNEKVFVSLYDLYRNESRSGFIKGIMLYNENSGDYTTQKRLVLRKSPTSSFQYRTVVEMNDSVLVINPQSVYPMNSKNIVDVSHNVSNRCMACNELISTLENTLYFSFCESCAKKSTHSRSVCKAHSRSYCSECSMHSNKNLYETISPIENGKKLMELWGIKGLSK